LPDSLESRVASSSSWRFSARGGAAELPTQPRSAPTPHRFAAAGARHTPRHEEDEEDAADQSDDSPNLARVDSGSDDDDDAQLESGRQREGDIEDDNEEEGERSGNGREERSEVDEYLREVSADHHEPDGDEGEGDGDGPLSLAALERLVRLMVENRLSVEEMSEYVSRDDLMRVMLLLRRRERSHSNAAVSRAQQQPQPADENDEEDEKEGGVDERKLVYEQELGSALSHAQQDDERLRRRQAYALYAAHTKSDIPSAHSSNVNGFIHRADTRAPYPSVQVTISGQRLVSEHYTQGVLTSALLAQMGPTADIQGIRWQSEDVHYSRANYRVQRTTQYSARMGIPGPLPALQSQLSPHTDLHAPFVTFSRTFFRPKPTYYHFQLRHLLHTPFGSSDLYYNSSEHWVVNYNTLTHRTTPIFFFQQQQAICSLLAHEFAGERLLIAGGMSGQLFAINLRSGDALKTPPPLTDSSNAICNAITPYRTPSGAKRILVSNNDSFARAFDLPAFDAVIDFKTLWAVNVTFQRTGSRPLPLSFVCSVFSSLSTRVRRATAVKF
jgi:hypothetical protein